MDRGEVASPTNSLQKNFATQEHDGPLSYNYGPIINHVVNAGSDYNFLRIRFGCSISSHFKSEFMYITRFI